MKNCPDKHRRRSIRLKGYDYSQPGAYFVTICAKDWGCLFGEIDNGEMILNETGKIVQSIWGELPRRFDGIGLDAHVTMPNHIHGIIIVRAQFIAPNPNQGAINQGAINRAPTLGEIVRAFKALSTRTIRKNGLSQFAWYRNYYEHVIRNEPDLNRIRQYIATNPLRWAEDEENPINVPKSPLVPLCGRGN